MNKNSEENSIKKKILDEIEKGDLDMHSRVHFILKGALVLFALIFSVLTLLYLVSFVIYFLKQTGAVHLPSFGLRGLAAFLGSFPWALVVLGILLLLLVEVLSRRYSFGYRTPGLYFIFASFLVVAFGGVVVAETSLHPCLHEMAHDKKLPAVGVFYRSYEKPGGRRPEVGKVLGRDKEGLLLQDLKGRRFLVATSEETHVISDSAFEKDDLIIVGGRARGDRIKAFGIRKVRADQFPCSRCLLEHHKLSDFAQ